MQEYKKALLWLYYIVLFYILYYFYLFYILYYPAPLSSHWVWINGVFVGKREARVEQNRPRRPEAGRRLQADSLHLSGCGAPPPVSHHALRHRGALPTVATEATPGQPTQHLCHPLPRELRGESGIKENWRKPLANIWKRKNTVWKMLSSTKILYIWWIPLKFPQCQ